MGDEGLLHMRLVDWTRTSPTVPAFSRAFDDSPVFSPDGDRLYFPRARSGRDIWHIERTADGWSSPTALPQAVNSLIIHWQLSVADNGDLYFAAKVAEKDDQDIYRAELVNLRGCPTMGSTCSLPASGAADPKSTGWTPRGSTTYGRVELM
ncbi:MAG: hypothetical protein Q8P50_10265 [Bacillota bacterium]|nr:hypothetical protein [Bacillota bacterium]